MTAPTLAQAQLLPLVRVCDDLDMAEIHGTINDDRFQKMSDLLSASLDDGGDVGASVSVTVEGETVVDIWGGYADEAKTTPWQEDTITNVWSTTKTMTFLSALVLVDRGQLDFNEKVATYWPEFAQNGKDAVEVRHLMSHTSGVSGWEQPVTNDDIYDWELATSKLAAQAPWWEPGTASGYHALNQGHLIGEVVRRVDGRMLNDFFAEEIAGPLNADFQIGAAESTWDRIANVIPPTGLPVDPTDIDVESVAFKTFTGPAPSADTAWEAPWRGACIGAANGHGNARSVARIQAIVANGGTVDGVTLLSPDTIKQIFVEQSYGTDLVLGLPVRFGMGYALPSMDGAPHLVAAASEDANIGYWGGWGGSSIIVDADRRMTVAYMMNRMADDLMGDLRGVEHTMAAFEALAS